MGIIYSYKYRQQSCFFLGRLLFRLPFQVTFVGDDETVDEHKNHDPKHTIPGPVDPLTPLPPVRPTTILTSSETPDGCEGHYDAVSFLRGELFIFKDSVSDAVKQVQ